MTAPAFDGHHPPRREQIDDCVHCGFCLPACPTYLLWGQEMDSPRGRIDLMRQVLEGEPLRPDVSRHFDRCLGCMACMTACPSGVQYGQLLEATRQQVERRQDRRWTDRVFRAALFAFLPHPARLRWLRRALAAYEGLRLDALLKRTGLARWLPERLRAAESLRPELRPIEDLPAVTPATGEERRRVALLTGCVQRVFFSGVNAATVRVLAAHGCTVAVPSGQGCCGALSLHAGREAEAQDLARRTIAAFEPTGPDPVVVNAAGCGSAMKEYGHLLRDDPAWSERARALAARVRDLSELLEDGVVRATAPPRPLPLVVAYQDACHLAHAQGLREPPRRLLRAIPGLELREIGEADLCCGSAGIYNLVEPAAARELGRRKAERVLESGAALVVTANPGCLVQIRTSLRQLGSAVPVLHLAELLDSVFGADRADGSTGVRLPFTGP